MINVPFCPDWADWTSPPKLFLHFFQSTRLTACCSTSAQTSCHFCMHPTAGCRRGAIGVSASKAERKTAL